MSEELAEGSMRIVLSWEGTEDFDSHLEIPCTSGTCSGSNAADKSHLWFDVNQGSNDDNDYHIYTDIVSSGDNVTLDRDDMDGAPGTETITITKIRSGTYRYSVQDYSNRNNASSRKLADSGTTVTAYYNNTEIPFSLPNSAGNLWTVFTFNGETRVFTAQDNMTYHADYDTIQ